MNDIFSNWQRLLLKKANLVKDHQLFNQVLQDKFAQRYYLFDYWYSLIKQLPIAEKIISNQPVVQLSHSGLQNKSLINGVLQELIPWRKGRFDFFGVTVEGEWRSDWKMQRLIDLPIDFADKEILDVGCGNGYFLARLIGLGAKIAVGVDPSWHYFAQFLSFLTNHQLNIYFLPITLGDLVLRNFDISLSMGVLYHRRNPLDHLEQMRESLKSGGQLILETLVVDGDEKTVLMPVDRYAGMKNVWFLPSVDALLIWLKRLHFQIDYVGTPVLTTLNEQRNTNWLNKPSLIDFMQKDLTVTIENLPPPKRVMIVAKKK